MKNALYIQKHEGGDAFIISATALVHDICRPWEKKTGKSHSGKEALEIINQVLQQAKIEPSKRKQILEIVAEHDIYDWTNKNTRKNVELKVIQDADNLDAIGAIGIGRTFAFGGAHGLSMYHPRESLNVDKDFVEDPDHRTSTIAHFYEKLLRLKQNMNTATGKRLAGERHQVMENFLKQFFKEWEGDFKQ